MFSIERTKVEASIVDAARDVRLHSLRTEFHGRIEWFVMQWGDRTIPIGTSVDTVREPSYKRIRTITGLGDDVKWALLEANERVAPYEFPNAAERREALMMAVEALVVFGGHYNGLEQDGSPPDQNWIRVCVAGEPDEYTLDSFGYRNVAH